MDWNEEYAVGIAEIDRQHRDFVEHITAVEDAVRQNARWSTVHAALVRLAGFAEIHFAVEESLMRIHDYPHLEEHAHAHHGFREWVRELQQRSLRADLSPGMVDFLRNWIASHIPDQDRRCAFHFLKVSALGAPQRRTPSGRLALQRAAAM